MLCERPLPKSDYDSSRLQFADLINLDVIVRVFGFLVLDVFPSRLHRSHCRSWQPNSPFPIIAGPSSAYSAPRIPPSNCATSSASNTAPLAIPIYAAVSLSADRVTATLTIPLPPNATSADFPVAERRRGYGSPIGDSKKPLGPNQDLNSMISALSQILTIRQLANKAITITKKASIPSDPIEVFVPPFNPQKFLNISLRETEPYNPSGHATDHRVWWNVFCHYRSRCHYHTI